MNSSLALPRLAESHLPSLPAMSWPSGRGMLKRASDGLRPAQRRVVTGLIVAAHVAAAWAMFNARPVLEAPPEAHGSPIFVSLIAPAAPAAQPKAVEKISPKVPKPVARPLVAAPSPRPAVFQAPVVSETRAAAPAPTEKAVEAPPSVAAAPEVAAAPTAPLPPLPVPSSAVQYLQKTTPAYPAASRRLGEAGKVLVGITVDEAGLPHNLRLVKSSGYSRLDDTAMNSVASYRFKPYVQNGRAIAVMVNIPVDFELE